MAVNIDFTLPYTGRKSDQHEIDFYDVADALVGFQRYLALTTNLLVNNEIITQAPSLKNARIYAVPPEEGSWKLLARVAILSGPLAAVGGGVFAVGTAEKDTPVGNLGRSVYGYVVKEIVGVHPDYDKTIGEQYEDEKRKNPNFPDLSQSRLDSLVEKCHSAVYRMHRPIVASRTAKEANIYYDDGRGDVKSTGSINKDTFDYMAFNKKDAKDVVILGRVTSYNINTYKGRIYLPQEGRPIPFILHESARSSDNINLLAASLAASARGMAGNVADLRCFVLRTRSRTDRLKSLMILHVMPVP